MNIDPNISVVISFIGFSFIFAKKVYPFLTNVLDKHIENVKNKIKEAETLKEAASLSLTRAYTKKDDIDLLIEKNKLLVEARIERLKQEHEQYIRDMRDRYATSLKNQLETELEKQKKQLIEKISNMITEKLLSTINEKNLHLDFEISPDDLQKIIK